MELWSQQFQVAGFSISNDADNADLLVFNSCAVTQEAVRKSRKQINRLKRNNPDAKVVVSGCFVSLNEPSRPTNVAAQSNAAPTSKTVGKIDNPQTCTYPEFIDLVVPNAQKDDLVPLIINEWFADLANCDLPENSGSTPPHFDENQRRGSESDTTARQSAEATGASAALASAPGASSPAYELENSLKNKDHAGSRRFPIFPILSSESSGLNVAPGVTAGTTPEIAKSDTTRIFSRARQRAFIKIQDGCRYKCTYCIVTVARGRERSRSVHELVTEVRQLHEQGIQEIVLTGVHVGGYGSDTGESLANLLQALLNDTAVPRIRFASVEPWDLEDQLLTVMLHPRVMPHMHLPVQSGSNSVLQRMARRCKTDDFQGLVNNLRQSMPDFNVTTDIIVGFPGETEAEWQDTLRFVENTSFGHIHIFPFSPREGTHAAKLTNQVNGAVRKRRAQQLKRLADSGRQEFLSRFSGRTMDVLWESAKTIDPSENKAVNQTVDNSAATPLGKDKNVQSRYRYHGYTPNYIRVYCDLEDSKASGKSLENRILPTKLSATAFDNSGATTNAMLSGSIK